MLTLGIPAACAIFLLSLFLRLLLGIIIDSRRLRRFPTPSLWATTPFWLMYHNLKGRRFLAVDEAHERLGSVVRISSNHISFSDPKAFKQIYNFGGAVVKDDFYETIAEGNPSMAQTSSKVEHAAKRRNMAHVFSAQQIRAVERRIQQIVQKLCRNVALTSQGLAVGPDDQYSVENGAFDLRPWMNMFSYDAITSIFWSNSYGFLDRGSDICMTQLASGEVKAVHAMDSYHSAVHFNAWLAHLPRGWYNFGRKILRHHHGQRAGAYFSGMARWLVQERLKTTVKEPDLFSALPVTASEKRPNPMTLDQIHAECTTMLDAGNDTTQTSLISYERSAPPYESLQQVPYLRACLDESFRLRTPSGFGLPRKDVESGVCIAGYEIAPGTTVSGPLYTLHRNESLFGKAHSFIPERWLLDQNEVFQTSEEERQNLKDHVLPFSLGSRACIRRNLAYMELSIVIAALVMSFEWEMAEPDAEMVSCERFNYSPKELFVRCRRLP
ncbi:Cytochrome P450 monooxygenase 89 [Exophiala dermatitidis]